MPRALLAIALLSGCASAPTAHERLLDVGRSYGQLTRVNAAAHWAPLLCRLPAPPTLISRSVDPATHGRKLYHLFVRHERAYVRREAGPDDQVLVKEAWEPAPAASKEEEGVAIVDGRPFKPGRKAELFVMMRSGELDSDQGWTYAVLSPDGGSVKMAGRLGACMECHAKAGPSRVFGLPKPGR